MSDQTLRDLEAAIQAHIADQEDQQAIATHWHLIVAVADLDPVDGHTAVRTQIPDGQPAYVTAGLIHVAAYLDAHGWGPRRRDDD